jgi:hypothetical protein
VNHCCLCLPHPIEFEELNVRDCYELRVSVRISTWLKIYILNTFPRIPVMALLGSWCFWIDFSTTNISKET